MRVSKQKRYQIMSPVKQNVCILTVIIFIRLSWRFRQSRWWLLNGIYKYTTINKTISKHVVRLVPMCIDRLVFKHKTVSWRLMYFFRLMKFDSTVVAKFSQHEIFQVSSRRKIIRSLYASFHISEMKQVRHFQKRTGISIRFAQLYYQHK